MFLRAKQIYYYYYNAEPHFRLLVYNFYQEKTREITISIIKTFLFVVLSSVSNLSAEKLIKAKIVIGNVTDTVSFSCEIRLARSVSYNHFKMRLNFRILIAVIIFILLKVSKFIKSGDKKVESSSVVPQFFYDSNMSFGISQKISMESLAVLTFLDWKESKVKCDETLRKLQAIQKYAKHEAVVEFSKRSLFLFLFNCGNQ